MQLLLVHDSAHTDVYLLYTDLWCDCVCCQAVVSMCWLVYWALSLEPLLHRAHQHGGCQLWGPQWAGTVLIMYRIEYRVCCMKCNSKSFAWDLCVDFKWECPLQCFKMRVECPGIFCPKLKFLHLRFADSDMHVHVRCILYQFPSQRHRSPTNNVQCSYFNKQYSAWSAACGLCFTDAKSTCGALVHRFVIFVQDFFFLFDVSFSGLSWE